MANIYSFTDTWNDGGVDWDAIKVNVDDQASGAGSKLLDLQVGGASRFSVSKAGDIDWAGKLFSGQSAIDAAGVLSEGMANVFAGVDLASGGSRSLPLDELSSAILRNVPAGSGSSPGITFTSHPQTGLWSSSGVVHTVITATTKFSVYSTYTMLCRNTDYASIGESQDVRLYRDAANQLALRNGINPQSFAVYNTYTSSSVYERMRMYWDSGNAWIAAQAEGMATSTMYIEAGALVFRAPSTNAFSINGSEVASLRTHRFAAELEVDEQGSAPSGEANKAKIYAEDNGSGKTRLMVQFGTGAAQQIAIEP